MSSYHFVTISFPNINFLSDKELSRIKKAVEDHLPHCRSVELLQNLDEEICLTIFSDGNGGKIPELAAELKKIYREMRQKEVDVEVRRRI